MTTVVDLPEETKDTLLQVLKHAAGNERAVIEFQKNDGELFAMEITEHVEELEAQNE